jgi:tetratricopeptide (TPR) repeat protein
MGLYWDRNGSPALARHYYEAAYSQDGHNVALCLEIAASYAAQGEYPSAEVWLLYAAEIDPDDPNTWETLTRFYLDSGIGVRESGVQAASQLLELTPNDAAAHDLAGWAYFLIDEDDQASTHLLQALELDPNLASAHYHVGRLHARRGNHEEASQAYRRAADFDSGGRLRAELERAWDELGPNYTQGQ